MLTPVDIRQLAAHLGVRPTKSLGQNFVHDAGTVRKIVRAAGLGPGQRVLEVGPGLGSLTLGLLEAGASVVAVEIDPELASHIDATVRSRLPQADFEVVLCDALKVEQLPGLPPTALVANLPYNVAVPIVLTMLERFPSIGHVLVMVQAEVADRLAALPGSKTYGVPSAKAAWYAKATRSLNISRNVFWPVPGVDSALVALDRRQPPATSASRQTAFEVIDAAFGQRRKMIRAALAGLFGSSLAAQQAIEAAGLDPTARGEMLDIHQFAAIAEQLEAARQEAAGNEGLLEAGTEQLMVGQGTGSTA